MIDVILYGLIIFIVVCVILIWYITTYNRFQEYIIRINEVESNIDSVLRKRFDLLNKSIGIIKSVVDEEKEILSDIESLRSQKLSNFELDRKLYTGINEFYVYKEEVKELSENENFLKIDLNLNETEIEISALRKYYNDIITDYNKFAKTIPSVIVAKICHYNVKPYFDGKDMTDDVINDFKL